MWNTEKGTDDYWTQVSGSNCIPPPQPWVTQDGWLPLDKKFHLF